MRRGLCALAAMVVAWSAPAIAGDLQYDHEERLLGFTPDGKTFVVVRELRVEGRCHEVEAERRALASGEEALICADDGTKDAPRACPGKPLTTTSERTLDEAALRALGPVARLKLTLAGHRKGKALAAAGVETRVARQKTRLVFSLRIKGAWVALGRSEEHEDLKLYGEEDPPRDESWSHDETTWEARGRSVVFHVAFTTMNGTKSELFGFVLKQPVDLSKVPAEKFRPPVSSLLDLSVADGKLAALAKDVDGTASQVARALNARGMRLYRQRQHLRAARAFELAAERAPKYELALYNRACVAGLQKDGVGAATWLRKLRAVGSKRGQALLKGAAKDKDLAAVRASKEVKEALR